MENCSTTGPSSAPGELKRQDFLKVNMATESYSAAMATGTRAGRPGKPLFVPFRFYAHPIKGFARWRMTSKN